MADKVISVTDARTGQPTEAVVHDGVPVAALGQAVQEIQQNMAEIQRAFHEQRGQATLDVEKIVEAFTTQTEALRGLIQDRQEVVRKGAQIGREDPLEMRIMRGPLRGQRYSDAVTVFRFLEKLRLQAPALEMVPEIRNKIRPPSEDLRQVVEEYRAYTTGATGGGAEWMPAGDLSERIWPDVYISADVVSQFPIIKEMPTDPFEWPLDLDDSGDEWSRGIQNVDVEATDASTRDNTMRTAELVNAKAWSKNFEENSLFAVLPVFEKYLIRTGREHMDKYAMNADKVTTSTGNINLDDSMPSSNKYWLAASNEQDGLRKQGIVDNTAQLVNAGGDALVIGDINSALGRLGKYAAKPSDVRIFSEVMTYIAGISALAEVQTVDKFGPRATIHTGQVANLKGSPVIMTGAIGRTEADGKISATAANNTLGQIVLTNIMAWMFGFKRGLELEIEYRPLRRKLYLVASYRMAIGSFGTRSSAIHTAVIRNILVS